VRERKSTQAREREKARCGRCRCFARSINNAGSHRWAHGARRQISFARLYALQEPKRWVHGATMIKHVQACDHMLRGFTRQYAAARSCVPIPSLCLLTCIVGNEFLSGIVACCRRSVPAVSNNRQRQGITIFAYIPVCSFSLCLPARKASWNIEGVEPGNQRHQEITRVILCRLILNDMIIHMKFLNDINMFSKIVQHFCVSNFENYAV